MAQIFSRAADTYLRLVMIALALGAGGGLLLVAGGWVRSDYVDPGESRRRPSRCRSATAITPGELGIDCRYCHNSVETAASAGYPPTHTCMTCHSQLWTNADVLAPVRQSLASGTPLRWSRVYDLPDYVYFNHGIHVQKGVALRALPRAGARDGPDLPGGVAARWAGAWSATAIPKNICGRPTRSSPSTGSRPPTARSWGASWSRRAGIEPAKLDNCYLCHR